MLFELLKGLTGAAKAAIPAARPAVLSAFDSVSSIMKRAPEVSPVRGGALKNVGAFEDIAGEASKMVSAVDIRSLHPEEAAKFNSIVADLHDLDSSINVSVDGIKKTNKQIQIEAKMDKLKTNIGVVGLSGDHPISKFITSFKRTFEPVPGSSMDRVVANIVPEDGADIDRLLNSPELLPINESIDEILDINATKVRLQNAVQTNGLKSWISTNTPDIGNEGFVQNVGRFFNYYASDETAIGEMVNSMARAIESNYDKNRIFIEPETVGMLGNIAAYKMINSAIEDVLKPALKKDKSIADDVYRISNSGKKVSVQDFYSKLDSMRDGLRSKISLDGQSNALAKRVAVYDGKSFGRLKGSHEFTAMIPKSGNVYVPDTLKFMFLKGDSSFNNVFKYHLLGDTKVPPIGISKQEVEIAASNIAKAIYFSNAKLGEMSVAAAMKYGMSVARPLFLKMSGFTKHLEEILDPILADKEYMRRVVQRLDNEVFESDVSSKYANVVRDQTLSKDVIKNVDKGIASQIKNYMFSNRGHTGAKDFFIDSKAVKTVDELAEEAFGGKKGVSDGIVSKEAQELSKLLERNKWDDILDEFGRMFPVMKNLFKGEGFSGVFRQDALRYERMLNAIHNFTTDMVADANKLFVKDGYGNTAIVGLFHNGVDLSERQFGVLAKKYNHLLELDKKFDRMLHEVGYYKKGEDTRVGSQIIKSGINRVSKTTYDEIEQEIRNGLRKKKPIKDIVQDVFRRSNAKTVEQQDVLRMVMNDILNPFETLRTRLILQTKQLVQMGITKELKESGMYATIASEGMRKIPDSVIDGSVLHEILGTKSVYIPANQLQQLMGTVGEYSKTVSQSWKDMAWELNLSGNRYVRHLLLLHPVTKMYSEMGNFLNILTTTGMDPMQYFKYKSYASNSRRGYTQEWKDFISSGMSGSGAPFGQIEKSGASVNKASVDAASAASRYNVLSPESKLSDVITNYTMSIPDMESRFIMWKILRESGKGTDDIRKVLSHTMGFTTDVPMWIRKYAEIPGGDIFARYSYTMTANLAHIITHNPKQFAKTAIVLAAIQQATVQLFLDDKEKEKLANKKSFLRPSIFNTLRLDPSFATPWGQYWAGSYMSPFSTSINTPMESMNPIAQVITAAMVGKDAETVARENLKFFKRSSSTIDKLEQGDMGGVLANSLGYVPVKTER